MAIISMLTDQSKVGQMHQSLNFRILPLWDSKIYDKNAQEEAILGLSGFGNKENQRGRPDWNSAELADVLRYSLNNTKMKPIGSGYGGAKPPYIEFLLDKETFAQSIKLAEQIKAQHFADGISFRVGESYEADDIKKQNKIQSFGLYLENKKLENVQEAMNQLMADVAAKKLSSRQAQEYLLHSYPTPQQVANFFGQIKVLLQSCRLGKETGTAPEPEGLACANVLKCMPETRIDNLFDYFVMRYTGGPKTNAIEIGEIKNGIKTNNIKYGAGEDGNFSINSIMTPYAYEQLVKSAERKYFDDIKNIEREKNKRINENRTENIFFRPEDSDKSRT